LHRSADAVQHAGAVGSTRYPPFCTAPALCPGAIKIPLTSDANEVMKSVHFF
jgi:hypothetical protein